MYSKIKEATFTLIKTHAKTNYPIHKKKKETHCPCCKVVIIFPLLSNIPGLIAHIHHKIVWFSLSVYALTQLVVHIFPPLITYSSPFLTALVMIPAVRRGQSVWPDGYAEGDLRGVRGLSADCLRGWMDGWVGG